jgi:hypothetical protein
MAASEIEKRADMVVGRDFRRAEQALAVGGVAPFFK